MNISKREKFACNTACIVDNLIEMGQTDLKLDDCI